MDKPQEKGRPLSVVKSDLALKLAEQWVINMSEAEDDVQTEVEGRPSSLGLGAKVPRQTKIGTLSNPLEKRLCAKLVGPNRNNADMDVAMMILMYSGDLEIRTKVFDKKMIGKSDGATCTDKEKK